MNNDKEREIVKMLWFALLYGLVTTAVAGEMDEINAGIRSRAAALKRQPAQELRLPLTNGPVKEEPTNGVIMEAAPAPKYANWLQKPEARCTTYTVSVEACTYPNSRCPPPKTESQLQAKNLTTESED
jgi:hypothetical protein